MLGLGERELVSLVGGGGKSTLLFGLGDELSAAGKRVVLTTTTKMGRNQVLAVPTVCWSADLACVVAALDEPGPVMMLTYGDDHKVTGPTPQVVDDLFATLDADYVLVEADGSKGRPLKAPAGHEPVVPAASTTVAILVGIDAVGRPLSQVTHRAEMAQTFLGTGPDHILTAADCAAIVLHPAGALRTCPSHSRVIVVITKVTPNSEADAGDLAAAIDVLRPGTEVAIL
ncbi:MAG: selenium cofactor biosynthesis protein YqeC [Acidimicrobiia bacterium]|nr:selenium cofactor biosynthesis protein YqeC [Acidimicrobiia bacterium]